MARGFEQRFGVDVFETFAPVPRIETVRTMLAVATIRKLFMLQFDIATAFLNGVVEEDIYLEPPESLEVPCEECLKLNKALYGLKQVLKAWNQAFDRALSKLGFRKLDSDMCVYKHASLEVLLLIYVDDGIIIEETQEQCQTIADGLSLEFKVRQMSGEMFLGIELIKTGHGTEISQRRYIDDLLRRFNMADAKESPSFFYDLKNEPKISPVTTKAPYR